MDNAAHIIRKNAISELTGYSILKSEATFEVDLLLLELFNYSKKDFLVYPDKIFDTKSIEKFNKIIKKRIQTNAPIQYLINKAYFMGHDFYVDNNVLIPRPETELLVKESLNIANNISAANILDIGTGSGCIACMIAINSNQTGITASDISDKALKVAKTNASNLNVKNKIKFIQSNIYSNIKNKFDLIISNPPYIPPIAKENMQKEVLEHEPHLALFTEDQDGTYFYKQIIKNSLNFLNHNGYIAFEIGINQSALIKNIFEEEKFKNIKIIKDCSNISRVISAQIN